MGRTAFGVGEPGDLTLEAGGLRLVQLDQETGRLCALPGNIRRKTPPLRPPCAVC